MLQSFSWTMLQKFYIFLINIYGFIDNILHKYLYYKFKQLLDKINMLITELTKEILEKASPDPRQEQQWLGMYQLHAKVAATREDTHDII